MKVQDVIQKLKYIEEQRNAFIRADNDDVLPEYIYLDDVLDILDDYEQMLNKLDIK